VGDAIGDRPTAVIHAEIKPDGNSVRKPTSGMSKIRKCARTTGIVSGTIANVFAQAV
jgi:hypothetical protein